nr:hypothetical protein [uncultured Cetobacterium sp.]
MYINENSKDYTKDIFRCLLGLVAGFIICKYTTLYFGFLAPAVIFGTVFSMKDFSLKKFLKSNFWIVVFSWMGLFIGEIFFENRLGLCIITFGFFFSAFFFIHKNQSGIRMGILGYTYTTINSTYLLNVEPMVKDIAIIIVISGFISWILFIIFPNTLEIPISKKIEREEIHKDVKNTLKITIIIFLGWLLYMLFDIKDTFFAYATLCSIYGNLDMEEIYRVSLPNILINILGCTLAIIFSFMINGISSSLIVFSLGLMLLFYPMFYVVYYGSLNLKKTFLGLIKGTIFPIGLYLTPYGDITSKAFARALQISIMLLVSMVIIRILLFIEGDKNEEYKNTNINIKNK